MGYSNGDQYSVYGYSSYGPFFGGGNDLLCSNNGDWSSNPSSYPRIGIPAYFKVEDYEVFQVVKRWIHVLYVIVIINYYNNFKQ